MIETLAGAIVDWEALGKTALAALVAGTGVTLTFSVAIYGSTRAADLRRSGRNFESIIAAGLAGAALLLSLGAVVLGLIEVAS